MVGFLREASWLTAARARAWVGVLLAVEMLTAGTMLVLAHGGLDITGRPLGNDFVSFWTAGVLALNGHGASAYDPTAHLAAQRILFPGSSAGYYAFFYPPVFLLVCAALALVAYGPALLLWLTAAGWAFWRVTARIAAEPGKAPGMTMAVLAFPALWLNVGNGQNGLLSAALLGGFMLTLRDRPGWAGIWCGCLVFKPHLGLALPVALVAMRAWRTLAAAVATVVALAGLSWLVFGGAVWEAFASISPLARTTLTQESVGAGKMVSLFAAVRLLGGTAAVAGSVQGVISAGVCVVLAWVLARRGRTPETAALTVAACPLVTPFLLDYDLAVLAGPLAFLFASAQRDRFLPWEKAAMAAAYGLPLIVRTLALRCDVPLGPVVMALVFGLVLRRAVGEPGSEAWSG